MSRESAYRLRARDPQGLFALMWDEVVRRPRFMRRSGHSLSPLL